MSGLKTPNEVAQYLEKRKARLIVLTMNVTLNIQNRTQKSRLIQKVLNDVQSEFNIKLEKLAPSVHVTDKRYTLSKLMKVASYLITKLPNVQLYLARLPKKGKKVFFSEKGKTESVKSARLLVVLYEAGKNLSSDKVKRKLAIERFFKELAQKGFVFEDVQQSVKITKNKHSISRLIELAKKIESAIAGAKCFIVAKIPRKWLALYMSDEHVTELLTKITTNVISKEFTEQEIEIAKKLLEMLQKDKSWRKAIAKRLNGLNISTLEALEKILRKIVE